MFHATSIQASNFCKIEDKDFKSKFNGKKGTMESSWRGESPVLKKRQDVTRTL